MGKKKENKASGSNFIKKAATAILVVVLVIVMLTAAIFMLWEGIVSMITEFVTHVAGEAIEDLGHTAIGSRFEDWIKTSQIDGGFDYYIVNKEKVEILRDALRGEAVDTERSGLTEVRLRKIILAHLASSTFSDSLCAVEVSEEDILNNVKEKEYGRNFQSLDDFKNYCNNNLNTKYLGDIWANPDTWNYVIYYEDTPSSTVFFYFYDELGKFNDPNDPNDVGGKWYLAAMGATTIDAEAGSNLILYQPSEFYALKTEFDNFLNGILYESDGSKKKKGVKAKTILNASSAKAMKKAFMKTPGKENSITVYEITVLAKEYDYVFRNTKNGIEISMEDIDDTRIYSEDGVKVETREIDLKQNINMDEYAIPIELMLDMLNMTGSRRVCRRIY